MNVQSATILICTHNRARLLRETLMAVRALALPDDCDVQLVIVANNCTDGTPAVIEEAARLSPIPIVALTESRQGKSFALNRGLQVADGDIIALTDDDVWPDREWLKRIVGRFRERDVTFVFGKVLPRWARQPPPELLTPSLTTAMHPPPTCPRVPDSDYRLARTWRWSEPRSSPSAAGARTSEKSTTR
jgi:glycosyltransferase involved in cell wall biosynthesis